jgi:hypothetical protein
VTTLTCHWLARGSPWPLHRSSARPRRGCGSPLAAGEWRSRLDAHGEAPSAPTTISLDPLVGDSHKGPAGALARPHGTLHPLEGKKGLNRYFHPLRNFSIISTKARGLLSGTTIRGPLTTGKIALLKTKIAKRAPQISRS